MGVAPEGGNDWSAAFRRDVAAGSPRAMALAYALFELDVLAVVRRVPGPRDVALREDAAQEAWVTALTALPGLEFGSQVQLRAWLRRVARTKTIDIFRREGHRPAALGSGVFRSDLKGPTPTPAARRLRGKEAGGWLDDAVADLPPKPRCVWRLREAHRIAYKDIDQLFGWRSGNALAHLKRARKRLRKEPNLRREYG